MGRSGAGGSLGGSLETATPRRQWSTVQGVWWFGGASHLTVLAICTTSTESWMQGNTSAFWTVISWVPYTTTVLGLRPFISRKITTQSIHWILQRLGSPLITSMSLLGYLIHLTWTSLRIFGVTVITWCMQGIHCHAITMSYGRHYKWNEWGLIWTILHVCMTAFWTRWMQFERQVEERLTIN